jgi:hypothetical protein
MKPVTLSQECPEYKKLRQTSHDAIRAYQDSIMTPTEASSEALRQAMVLREMAKEHARVHKGKCLLCSNIRAGR